MNIVIEGCDGSGKSTIARYLCDTFGLSYWHESYPRDFNEYCQMLAFGGYVFDRFCLGQFIYNDEKDRKLSLQDLKILVNEVFPKTRTLLIYVDCATDKIIARLIERNEGNSSIRPEMEKWIKNIRGSYRQLLREIDAKFIEIQGDQKLC